MPDVTVEQAPAQPAPKAKPQVKSAAKPKSVATVTKSPSSAAASPQSSEFIGASTSDGSSASPLISNPGTPSAGVAGVPGASGAGAQAATAVDMKYYEDTPVFSVGDILNDVPGVSLKQGNGPRDMGISIRGSNARNGFAIRNIVILDDGFPMTQPDGLSRTDLIDPHAYAGVDVWRGPSSALFGNYATGGAINFRTYPGGAIDGVEYGVDVGSFGYSDFNTQTVNALMTYKPSSTDTFTFKFINNNLDAALPFRMSLQQFNQNPFQKGCANAASAAQGCVTSKFSATGNTASGVPQTAEQAGASRDDRRTVGGFRWEHAFDAATTGQVQVAVDDRNINQPTGTMGAVGDYLSYNVISGVTHRSTIAGLPTLGYLGAFWNYLPVDGKTFNIAPGGDARRGLLQSEQTGSTTNVGARARQEVKLTNDISVIAGATIERTSLDGAQRSYTYGPKGTKVSFVSANRDLTNIAPEIGTVYSPNSQWQWRARVGTGYGTPQFSNLFVGPDGQPGNNTALKSQTNVGFDVGADWTPAPGVVLSVTGFYEFFKNEIVSQSPAGINGSSFSFNAPASEHRGIEASADVSLGRGFKLTATYTFDDQIYTDYAEVLSGAASAVSRDGNKIPGVSPNEATARLSYDVPNGPLKGVGSYVEYQWYDGFFMENANLLKAPGYDLVNVNVHYNKDLNGGPIKSLLAYFEVQNVFDETYIASANNITDKVGSTAASLAATGNGVIYSGAPRTYYGGMKLKF